MPAPRRPLSTRIVVAFGVFGTVLAVALTALVLIAWEYAEHAYLERMAESELQYLRESDKPHSAEAGDLALYQGPAEELRSRLPPELAVLPEGSHWLQSPERLVRVEQSGGTLRLVSIELEDIEARERRLLVILLIGVLCAAYASVWAGFGLSRRIAEPVRALADSVERRQEGPNAPLAPAYADDEVGALARAFDDYEARIGALVERERRFTDQASHELRTPITVISGSAELLLGDTNLPAGSRRRVERILRAAREMTELVETFLLLARVPGETASQAEESATVATIARGVLDSQRVWLEDKPVELRLQVDRDRPAPAAERVLAIVLANLVRNACQYTERGLVEVRVHEHGVDVSDTGPGMATPGKAEGDKPRGTGLGLPLVSALCERQGWQIGWQSRPGGGTVAELRFAPASSHSVHAGPTGA